MRDTLRKVKAPLFAIFALLIAASFCSPAFAVNLKINLVLNDGSVLIYNGKAAGLKEGQTLNVTRAGAAIGSIQITKVTDSYAQAKIVAGSGAVREMDEVVPGDAAPAASSKTTAASSDKKASTDTAASTKSDSAGSSSSSSSSRSSRSSSSSSSSASSSTASSASSSPSTTSSSSGSSRSRRGGSSSSTSSGGSASSDSSSSSSSTTTSSSGSSRSRRGGSSSSSSASDDSSSASSDSSSTGDASATGETPPAALSKRPAYAFHAGYFFLGDQDVSGTEISNDASPMFSIDYTAKRKKNRNLVYNMMYSRPSLWTTYANQRQKYQMRIVQFSINYIWENFGETKLKKGIGGTQGTFAGLGVGYRSADSEYFCDVSCTGVQQFKKKSMEGLDYHGILGFMFKDNMEFKFDYCFDEQYYTLDLGYHY